MLLDDGRWKELEGAYRIKYDASNALKLFEKANNSKQFEAVFKELWNELHHQGDVRVASYFSVPHIIRIAKDKKLCDFNVFALLATIEIERHYNSPALPDEFKDEYLNAIREGILDLIRTVIQEPWDTSLCSTVLACLAVSKGHIELAKASLLMEDETVLKEFLKNY
jgi:hypothetical protein